MITDPADLPGSHRRYDCSPQEYQLVLDTAIPELVRSGLSADTRDIAVGAGVPATHPLLRDTRVLYDEAVRYAFRRLWPRPEDLDVERLVPAEAVRSLVRTAYRRHRADPDAVRLIISENVLSRGHLEGRNDVLETSPVVLQIDRVLMRGQDYGAFRPGISAEDVYVLITSLCCFPASQGGLFQLLYGTDMDHAATVEGLEKLACDTVLAFLTTSMPTTQGSSYTHAAPTTRTPSSVSAWSMSVPRTCRSTPPRGSPRSPPTRPSTPSVGSWVVSSVGTAQRGTASTPTSPRTPTRTTSPTSTTSSSGTRCHLCHAPGQETPKILPGAWLS
ncbi:MAG: TetR family transcriptional regulator [Corynebacterium sp.]|nr:TetR family transcriptional regulator [Corynebacterium sp.]